ncbi:MAG: chorismate synthase, partial [Atopobiaceae bacterium]|nr:chorismate synthase [Atopobiaceae bacterium]
MASSFGTALRVTIFGQSHSPAIGCVVEGLPAGFPVDQEALAAFMARRAPGQDAWATARKEADTVRIVGGLN